MRINFFLWGYLARNNFDNYLSKLRLSTNRWLMWSMESPGIKIYCHLWSEIVWSSFLLRSGHLEWKEKQMLANHANYCYLTMCACVCVWVCVRASACVWKREKESERDAWSKIIDLVAGVSFLCPPTYQSLCKHGYFFRFLTPNICLKIGHSRSLLIYSNLFYGIIRLNQNKFSLLLVRFEPRIFGVGSERSTNWATTTARRHTTSGRKFGMRKVAGRSNRT